MQKRIFILLFGLVFLAAGCADRGTTPVEVADQEGLDVSAEVEAQAWALLEQAQWSLEATEAELNDAGVEQVSGRRMLLSDFEREVITGNIVHYSVTVRTGPGVYDKIGVHRVVRERRPHRPIKTGKSILLLHGDLKRFETMFIPGQFSPSLPNDFGIAVYLAQNGVDVWGIDQGWNFVPKEETNFGFFADWGIQKDADHLKVALGIARVIRFVSGNGLGKMLLLGYSSGAGTGYALLNEESQLPCWRRHVKGFIAADLGVRSDDPDWIASGQSFVDAQEALLAAGEYADFVGFLQDVAHLARTDPDGDTPLVPDFAGFTNLQVALFFGGGPIFGPVFAHYHAPIIDGGLPVGFQFITIDQWLDFLTATANYEPVLFELDLSRMLAMHPSPYLTHLGDITVPVFDLGGAGGIAPFTEATLSYLGSTDITKLYVSTGASDPYLEYGHIDIFTASNAPALVWPSVLSWIQAHSESWYSAQAD